MNSKDIYLDNNATTMVIPEVGDAIAAALKMGLGNPSSAHSGGHSARALLHEGRTKVAALMGVDPDGLVFTSGGTEANNTVLLSLLRQPRTRRLITTTVEHSSVIQVAEFLETQGIEVVWIRPDSNGEIDPTGLECMLSDGKESMVSIQWVNNETGVIQDIEAIALACHSHGALFHTDAAQALGKLPLRNVSDIDFVTVTAHKLHGPKGVGALWARDRSLLLPLLHGGSQEESIRPGTENLVGVVGFGAAAAHRLNNIDDVLPELRALRDRFEAKIQAGLPWVKVNGANAKRICNTINIRFPGIDGQGLVAQLDGHKIYCSQSSACTNSRPVPSYVLRAMGLSEDQAYESIRFSFSELNNDDEIDYAVENIVEIAIRLRRITGFTEKLWKRRSIR